MTVQEELKYCLLRYPAIFPNKWAVYHHWFIVNGNGYKWKKGELVDGGLGADSNMSIEDAIEHHTKKIAAQTKTACEGKSKTIAAWNKSYHAKRLKETIDLVKDFDNRAKDFTPIEGLYGICRFSCLYTIPKNIKPDWLKAANEFKNYLIDNYSSFEKSDQAWIKKLMLVKYLESL